MQITIHSRSFEISDEMRERVERRVRFALDAFDGSIPVAHVQVEDVNGPRGGVDKRCHISVTVQGVGALMVGISAATVYSAVSRATRILKYRVSETLRQAQRPEPVSIRRTGTAA